MKNPPRNRAGQFENSVNGSSARRHRGRLANRRHKLRVGRLSELLKEEDKIPDPWWVRDTMRIRGYYPAHPHLFTVREVAGATNTTPKVIRAAARSGLIKSKYLPSESARKLFFDIAAVREFENRLRELKSGVLRSEKIALNTHFVRGDAVTIERAMKELGCKRRGVQYYLKRGVKRGGLEKIPCGHRTLLINRESLERLRLRKGFEKIRRLCRERKISKKFFAGRVSQ
jgi:hypothetical protein